MVSLWDVSSGRHLVDLNQIVHTDQCVQPSEITGGMRQSGHAWSGCLVTLWIIQSGRNDCTSCGISCSVEAHCTIPWTKNTGIRVLAKVRPKVHKLQVSKKKTYSISVGLDCSQPSISSHFHTSVECADRIARELDAGAKRDLTG